MKGHVIHAACLLLVCTVSLRAVPATAPTTQPVSAEQARQKFDALLQQGMDALAANQPEAALAVYFDARNIYDRHLKPKITPPVDNDQVAVLHGLAIVYQLMDKPEKASPLFDANSALDRACGAKSASRQLLLTRGALDVTQGYLAMRTVVRVTQYIKDHPDELDSELLDLLFSALVKAEERVANRQLTLEPIIKLYEDLNEKLEATRKGQKRYGTKWVTPMEYNESMAKRRAAIREYDAAEQRVDAVEADVRNAERALDRAKALRDRGSINSASNALAAARNRLAAARKTAADAKAKIPAVPTLTRAELDQLLIPHAVTLVMAPNPKSPAIAPASRVVQGGDIVVAAASPRTANSPTPAVQPAPAREFLGETRKKTFTRSAAGFAVGPDLILTSAWAVKDAKRVMMEFADGAPLEGVVERSDSNLALIRTEKKRMPYFNLGESFKGGPVKCPTFPEVSIFTVRVEEIAGSAAPARDGWTVSLQRHPRLPGAPLLLPEGGLIGVELATRDDPRERCTALSLEALKQFLAADLPATPCPNPASAPVVQITATFEK